MSFNAYRIWKMDPVVGTPELTIVLPVRDEATTIVADIATIAAHLCKRTTRWELLVADDSDSDSTARLVGDLDLANVTVITSGHERARVGVATCRALTAARGTTVAVLETRGAARIDRVDAVVATVESGVDLAAAAESGAGPERLLAMNHVAASRLGHAVVPAAGAPLGHDPIGVARRLGLRVALLEGGRHAGRIDSTRALRVAFVTSLSTDGPDLEASALELVSGLINKPEIGRLHLLHEAGQAPPSAITHDRLSAQAAWRTNSWRNALRIARAARRSAADVVVFDLRCSAFGHHRAAAALTHLAPLVLRLLGTPTVMLLSERIGARGPQADTAASSPDGPLCRLVTRASLQATRVVVTNPAYAAELAEQYRATNVFVAPQTCTTDVRTAVDAPQHSDRRIVAFGSFADPLQADALLESHRLLAAAGFHDVQLVIAADEGPGARGCLAQLTERAASMAGVVVAHRPDHLDVAGDQLTALLECPTTLVIAFGRDARNGASLRQVAAAGVAVVVDDGDEARRNGLLADHIDSRNPMSVAGALVRLLDDDTTRGEQVAHNTAAVRAIDLRTTANWHVANFESLTRSTDHGMS